MVDFVDLNSKSWKCDLIRSLYPYPTCKEILNTLITKIESNPDNLVWKHSSSGEYRVIQACSLIHKDQTGEVSEGLNNTPILEGIWKLI